MIRDGENLYIGACSDNELLKEDKAICSCEYLKIDIDYGVPYDADEVLIPRCNIQTEKFLFFFKRNIKCVHFKNKNFVSCNLYAPATARGTK